MNIVARIAWIAGVLIYATTYMRRFLYGDPAPRLEDATAILLIAGVTALVWMPTSAHKHAGSEAAAAAVESTGSEPNG